MNLNLLKSFYACTSLASEVHALFYHVITRNSINISSIND